MATKQFYVTRDMKHPLYKNRMLRADEPLELDGPTARLYRQLGVITDQKPKRAAPKPEPIAHDAPDLMEHTKAELIKMLPSDERKAAENLTKAKIVERIKKL